ncbi:MAG: hypothetical protein ACC662_02685, partial [Planctomycetota bacterium]
PRPPRDLVSRWVERARGKASRLPPADKLLPERSRMDAAPPRSGPALLPGDLEWMRRLAGQTPAFRMMEGVRTVLEPGDEIVLPKAAQSKPYVVGFEAARAGLYRVDLTLVRPGGRATLRWFVDAPRVVVNLPGRDGTLPSVARLGHVFEPRPATTTVTGYAELIRGRDLVASGTSDKPARTCLYFWLDPAKVPLDGRLRLRLEVVANDDFAPDDPIEQTHRGRADPTIRGRIRVQRQEPIGIAPNGSVRFPMTGALDASGGDLPLQVVRLAYQPAIAVRGRWITADGKAASIKQDGSRFELSIPQASVEGTGTLSGTSLLLEVKNAVGDPRTIRGAIKKLAPSGQALRIEWADGLVLGRADDPTVLPVVGQGPWRLAVSVETGNGTSLTPAEVIRDGKPVGGPHPSGEYRVPAPSAGLYHLLVPSTRFADLSTVGAVYDVSPGTGLRPYRSVEVRTRQQGGAPPTHHVVELFELEVSDQAEPDDDGNDDGPGEFQVRVTNVLLESPGAKANERAAIDQIYANAVDVEITHAAWPAWPGAWAPIPERRDAKTGKVRNVCYPRRLLGAWDVETLDHYDTMALSLVVVEDDCASSWQWLEQSIPIGKNVLDLLSGFMGADVGKFKDAIVGLVGKSMANYDIGNKDDVMGYLGYGSSKVRGYGLPSPDKYVRPGDYRSSYFFTVDGLSDPKDRTYQDVSSGASIDRASVTTKGFGSRWARAILWHRLVPALYARVGVEVVGFTLGRPVDEGGDPGDVYSTLEEPQTRPTAWWNVETAIRSARQGTWEYKNKLGVPINANDFVFVDQIYTAPVGTPVTTKVGRRPWTVDVAGYDPVSCFYVEAGFYDQDPGDDQLIGLFTRTFYLEDFLKYLGRKGVYTTTDGGRTQVSYYRDGPYVIGDFVFKEPGGALSELRLRVTARIWEG